MGHTFSNDTNNGNSEFTGAQPESLTARGAATKLRMKPSPNFIYIHHPNRWQIMGGKVYPVLAQLRQDPGVANVGPRNGGDMAPAIARKLEEGWTVIPHDVIEGGYVRKFDGVNGPIHLTKWETPRQHGLRAMKPKVDEAGYRAFLDDLMARGVIKPPPDYILEGMVENARASLERAAPYTATQAGKDVYNALQEDLNAVEIACGFKVEPNVVKPKPKAKRTRKKVTVTPKTLETANDE